MDASEDTPLHEQNFHNILLWMPNWIGDVILVLPALQALRKKFLHSRITAVVRAPADQLLLSHPAVDTVMQIPSGRDKGFLAGLRFALKLRKYQFDLGIVFPNSFHSGFRSRSLLLPKGPTTGSIIFSTFCPLSNWTRASAGFCRSTKTGKTPWPMNFLKKSVGGKARF